MSLCTPLEDDGKGAGWAGLICRSLKSGRAIRNTDWGSRGDVIRLITESGEVAVALVVRI